MKLNSVRLATILVITFIITGYIYPQGILVYYYTLWVLCLYFFVLVMYFDEESAKEDEKSKIKFD